MRPKNARSSRPAPLPSGAARAGRILVIDDERLVIKAVTRMLPRKHAVEPYTSTPEALARLENGERYDVILCDLMMPEMSGIEFYERVCSVCQEQASRIVFITGGAFIAEAREFLARVPNGRLHKPFVKETLLSVVSRFFTDAPGGS